MPTKNPILDSCMLSVRAARFTRGKPLEESCQSASWDGGQGRIPLADTAWKWTLASSPAPGRPDALDLTLVAEIDQGWGVDDAAIGLRFELPDWSPATFVLAPASVYAGNRFSAKVGIPYPPMVRGDDVQPDGPTLISDIQRLSPPGAEPSRFALRAGEMSTPCIGLQWPHQQRGLLVLMEHASELGEPAVQLEEYAAGTRARLTIQLPGVREHQLNSTRADQPRPDRGHDWRIGHRITLRLRVVAFACADVPALFARFHVVRKDLAGTAIQPSVLPFSAAWRLLEDKHNRENWNEAQQRYDTALDDKGRPVKWQLGWCGGMLAGVSLLAIGERRSRERAVANLDWLLCPERHGASGLWYDMYNGDERVRLAEKWPQTDDWTLIRRHGDALLAVVKQIAILQRDTSWSLPKRWAESIRREADALCRIWKEHGRLGQWVHLGTGAIILGDTSSGSLVPGALAAAANLLQEPLWLEAACAMAGRFAVREIPQGFTNGGPGDALQVPDSESAIALLDSFAILHERTGDRRWLDAASAMSDQVASWVASYDHPLPAISPLGRIGARTTGTVWANAQNRHSAPGFCTVSGDGLLRLFRATGEQRHLELLRDVARALPQFVSRPEARIAGMPDGYINERVNTCDWEACWGRDVGDVFRGSCWPEVSLMFTIAELPGLYVRPDFGLVCALDHVDAEVLAHDGRSLRARLRNRTPHDAIVQVLCEDGNGAKRPLGFAGLRPTTTITVPAGAVVEHSFTATLASSGAAR